ncbi:MAG: FAD-dependent oxidoreductase [Deltaproteobacteria bacterium]|nr:FAD-dependent oxidoreductase [Deltaproteobacteria bacterium]
MEVILLLNNRTGETSSKKIDRVFIAIGYEPTVEFALKTEVKLTVDGFIKCDANHRTNISGIYGACDMEGGL